MARLWEQLIFVLRLDEPDPAAAWHARLAQLHEAGKRVDCVSVRLAPLRRARHRSDGRPAAHVALRVRDARHADGRRDRPRAQPPDRGDRDHARSHPCGRSRDRDEAPRCRWRRDPRPARPLRRRTSGRDRRRRRRGAARRAPRRTRAPRGSARWRSSIARDGSARPETVFFNTLLDENAASHVALGNAYAISVGDEDRHRINKSSIHIDFMIGSDDVTVTGVQADGTEVPVLRGGDWQV